MYARTTCINNRVSFTISNLNTFVCFTDVGSAIGCYHLAGEFRYDGQIIQQMCKQCLLANVGEQAIRMCVLESMNCQTVQQSGKLEFNFTNTMPTGKEDFAQMWTDKMNHAFKETSLTNVTCCNTNLCNKAGCLSINAACLIVLSMFCSSLLMWLLTWDLNSIL